MSIDITISVEMMKMRDKETIKECSMSLLRVTVLL